MMKITPNTHLVKIIHAIQHVHTSRLETLLLYQPYHNLPKSTFIEMMTEALRVFRVAGDDYLNLKPIPCPTGSCSWNVRHYEFYSPAANKRMQLGIKVHGGHVVDIFPCVKALVPTIDSKISDLVPDNGILQIDKKAKYRDFRKNNPPKENEEILTWCRILKNRLEAILQFQKEANDISNFFLNEVGQFHNHMTFYNIELDDPLFRKFMYIFEAYDMINTFYYNKSSIEYALKQADELNKVHDKLNWLSYYSQYNYNQAWHLNADGEHLSLINYPEMKTDAQTGLAAYNFISMYKKLESECWAENIYYKSYLIPPESNIIKLKEDPPY